MDVCFILIICPFSHWIVISDILTTRYFVIVVDLRKQQSQPYSGKSLKKVANWEFTFGQLWIHTSAISVGKVGHPPNIRQSQRYTQEGHDEIKSRCPLYILIFIVVIVTFHFLHTGFALLSATLVYYYNYLRIKCNSKAVHGVQESCTALHYKMTTWNHKTPIQKSQDRYA